MSASIPPLHVLVVENDHALAELLLRALHRAELTADVAADVTEAKRLLARGSYKVLVLELILPDGTGFDVLDFITSPAVAPPHVVVITPYDPSILGRIARSPAQIVMFKPLDLVQFAGCVRALAIAQPRRIV